jgi:hypothetical protein
MRLFFMLSFVVMKRRLHQRLYHNLSLSENRLFTDDACADRHRSRHGSSVDPRWYYHISLPVLGLCCRDTAGTLWVAHPQDPFDDLDIVYYHTSEACTEGR